ncbi:MAG: ACT domain-containing protein [Deltaproteobacteria bacterium]|nr:ACT domain-containing protein [Deltaproteobacteria bacterium]RLA91743.1 MAG: ACT domain-containing protein [Deltaproteobacteria bacterium]
MSEKVIITVLGQDRIGIVAEISSILYKNHINILDITQKILGDEIFTMTMLVDISTGNIAFAQLKKELEEKGKELNLKIIAQHEDIFNFMHRI